jgi:ABC-type uncharacterized transport system substrate-binding protein
MHPALTIMALFGLPMMLASPDAPDQSSGSGNRKSPPVVLVKSAGVRAVQEVADAFSDGCRVHVQQLNVGDSPTPTDVARARESVGSARVLVAVGQPAVELLAGVRARVIYALAPDPPPGTFGTNNSAPPYNVFRALLQGRRQTRRIAVVSSERGAHRLAMARSAARSLGLELVELPAADSAAAIRALRALFVPLPEEPDGTTVASPVDALWLGADPQLIDTQVLQFVLQMQIQWQVPVVAATRQQVAFGALLAVDWPLEAVGRHLAWQVNQLLDDPDHFELVAGDHPGGIPEAVLNAQAARRLGIDVQAMRHLPSWKVIER